MSGKPKGSAFYLGRFLQAFGAAVCVFSLFKFFILFTHFFDFFKDLDNSIKVERTVGDQWHQMVSVFPQMASVFPTFLIGMVIAGVGSALTYEKDAETHAARISINNENNNTNINSGGGHVSDIAGGSISRNVTTSIAQLRTLGDPNAKQLADLLYRLQIAIEADHSLKDTDKTEALEQVKALSEANKNKNPQMAKIATRVLKQMMSELPTAVTFLETCNKLLPMIARLAGLG
ncbi:MAG: hypothetical protein LH660_05560 [Phormidesmis sp. CAN_BIN36]|nr:hypothetical protein [Phormidesmis sp. CAN_BIN36]